MNKILISILLIIYVNIAYSSIGVYLPQEMAPDQSCAIIYADIDTKNGKIKSIESLCSGTVVSSKHVLTAGHCEAGTQHLAAIIRCPNHKPRIVNPAKRDIHPDYSGSNNQHDIAVLEILDKFNMPPMPLPKDGSEVKSLIAKGDCAFWGYGLDNNGQAGTLQGVKYHDSGATWGPGVVGVAGSSQPLQGDSGGGLYCKDSKGQLIRVGTVSSAERGIASAATLENTLDWVKSKVGKIDYTSSPKEEHALLSRRTIQACNEVLGCLENIGGEKAAELSANVTKILKKFQSQAKSVQPKKKKPAKKLSSEDLEIAQANIHLRELYGSLNHTLMKCKAFQKSKTSDTPSLTAKRPPTRDAGKDYDRCVKRLHIAAEYDDWIRKNLESIIKDQCVKKSPPKRRSINREDPKSCERRLRIKAQSDDELWRNLENTIKEKCYLRKRKDPRKFRYKEPAPKYDKDTRCKMELRKCSNDPNSDVDQCIKQYHKCIE